jgi:small-conductance mechanosensitive channel
MEKTGYIPQETYILYFKPELNRPPHHFPKDETQRQRLERLWRGDILDIRGADEPAPKKKSSNSALDTLLEKSVEQKKALKEKDAEIAELKRQLGTQNPELEAQCKKLKAEGLSYAKISVQLGITLAEARKYTK